MSGLAASARVPALMLVAATAAVCGAFVHPLVLRAGSVPLPVGVVLAVAGAAAALAMGTLGARTRWGSGLVAGSWVLPVGVLSAGRPEGDVVIALDPFGLVFLLSGLILAGVAVGLPAGGLR